MLDFLVSTTLQDACLRTALFTAWWCAVRLALSATLFAASGSERVVKGTKMAAGLHASGQALATIWLVLYDPDLSPLIKSVASFSATEQQDLVNVRSPAIALLGTASPSPSCAAATWASWLSRFSLSRACLRSRSRRDSPLGIC